MIDHLTVLKPHHSITGKIFFPEHILLHMGWNKNTPLTIKPMMDGFGVIVHRNMMKYGAGSVYLKYRNYYNSPFIYTPDNFPLMVTYPIQCSYLIVSSTHPKKLSIIMQYFLRKTSL